MSMVLPIDLLGYARFAWPSQYQAGVLLYFLKKHTHLLDTVPHLRHNNSRTIIGIKTYMEAWFKYPPHQLHNLYAAMIAKNMWVSKTEWVVNRNHKGLILAMLDVVSESGIMMMDASMGLKKVVLSEGKISRQLVAGGGVIIWPGRNVRDPPINAGGKGVSVGGNSGIAGNNAWENYYFSCGKLPLVEDREPVNNEGATDEGDVFDDGDFDPHPLVGNNNALYELRAMTKGISTMLFRGTKLSTELGVRGYTIMVDNLNVTNVLTGVLSVPDEWHYHEFMTLFSYLRRMDWYKPEHIYREKNWVADELALFARKSDLIGDSWGVPLPHHISLLIEEKIGDIILAQQEFESLVRVDQRIGIPKGMKCNGNLGAMTD